MKSRKRRNGQPNHPVSWRSAIAQTRPRTTERIDATTVTSRVTLRNCSSSCGKASAARFQSKIAANMSGHRLCCCLGGARCLDPQAETLLGATLHPPEECGDDQCDHEIDEQRSSEGGPDTVGDPRLVRLERDVVQQHQTNSRRALDQHHCEVVEPGQ